MKLISGSCPKCKYSFALPEDDKRLLVPMAIHNVPQDIPWCPNGCGAMIIHSEVDDRMVLVRAASPIGGQVIPEVTIRIGGDRAGTMDGVRRVVDVMNDDADRIVEALVKSLPGGTLMRVAARLFQRHADECKLVVPK